jgi:hypothetical protein
MVMELYIAADRSAETNLPVSLPLVEARRDPVSLSETGKGRAAA